MPVQSRKTCLHTRVICLGTILLALLASCTSNGYVPKAVQVVTPRASSPIVPDVAELSAFIPAGATLGLAVRGDIDADGDEDALIVYRLASGTDDTPRALLLLLRDADGALRKSVMSPNAILCRKCSGMMGDPLQQIRTGRGEFTLRFEGGSRERWSSEYKFEYVRDRGIWKLTEILFVGFDRANGKAAEKRKWPAEFGDVTLQEFDAASFPADALP
jgi:hypothetical protein